MIFKRKKNEIKTQKILSQDFLRRPPGLIRKLESQEFSQITILLRINKNSHKSFLLLISTEKNLRRLMIFSLMRTIMSLLEENASR